MINEQRLVDTFLKLAKINGPSHHENDVADALEEELRSIGFEVKRDDAGTRTGGDTGNLIAFKKGTIAGAIPITFNAHMDTVAPTTDLEINIEDGVIRSNGATILGADDRAGIAAIVEALRVVDEVGVTHGDIQVILSVSEEIGLFGAKNLDPGLVTSECIYVFDVGKPAGGITLSAPYQDNITALVRGRASHAGAEPENGVSAILAASKAISNMKLGRIDPETTANIGVIIGGTATNIVPEYCKVKGEARSRDEAKLKNQTQSMVKALHEGGAEVGAEVLLDISRSYDGYKLAEDDPIIKLAVTAARRVGIEPEFQLGGGGSDANVFNAKGIPAVPIGIGYEHPHSTEESLAIADLAKSAEMVLSLIHVAAEG